MDRFRVRMDIKHLISVFLLVFVAGQVTNALNVEYTPDSGSSSPYHYEIDHSRVRRDAPPPASSTTTPSPVTTPPTTEASNVTSNATPGSNKTTTPANTTEGKTSVPTTAVSVTQIPLLGVNGSGQLHVDLSGKTPKVSDPIDPDDSLPEIFKETPERIASEQNLKNLTYDNHDFYNSTFIGNLDYFNEYWSNISIQKAHVHSVLSNSHRRATSIQLSFDFPFYGHKIRNVTVATGGFIYTGDHVHNWLAATQYIAPLMANFDTTLTNDSVIKLYDDGDKFTAFWENVTLQEDKNKTFTFAVTLYKNGDIIFAYKNIPMDVQAINDTEHPVKVGISDAYLTDKIVFYVRRKTIYEYHRVSFKDHLITNNTILKMVALPSCVLYETCDTCLNHKTPFNCSWCPLIQRCSSGTDRNKQDWFLRRCEQTTVVNASMCSPHTDDTSVPQSGNTAYTTDQRQDDAHQTLISPDASKPSTNSNNPQITPINPAIQVTRAQEARSPIGGVVAAFITLTIVCSAVAWVLYAFKNPHTRSGQLLIKYRPSQWNWRRGEARYTAATIHM